MEVYGVLFWVGKGRWVNILDGWRWIGKYFGWVGVGGGWVSLSGEWVHCLIMHINNTCSFEKTLYNTI